MSQRRFPPTQLGPALLMHAVCSMAVLALALTARDASAACSSFQPPPDLYVGDTASDVGCTNNDIQSAIDSATCAYGTNLYISREHTGTVQHLNIIDKNVTLIARGDSVTSSAMDVGTRRRYRAMCMRMRPALPTAVRRRAPQAPSKPFLKISSGSVCNSYAPISTVPNATRGLPSRSNTP